MDKRKIEKGYCSSCFNHTKHKLVEQNYVRRNIYQCTNCQSKTLQCRACHNFTRSGEKWDDEFCAEHSGLIASFKALNKKLNSIDDYKKIFKRESINLKKVGTIAAVTVGSVAMVTPLAFAAAPAIGGAIGTTVFGLSGAAASSAGLAAIGGGSLAVGGVGMAGGAAVIGAAGAALGGTLGGVVSNSYFSDVKDFGIIKIKSGHGTPVLFINGFLTQKDEDTSDWEKQLRKLYPDNPWYHVTWESKRLLDLGTSVLGGSGKEAIRKAVEELAKKATKEGSKKLGPIGPVLAAFSIVNNPWSVALIKAEQTGVLLADILARTNEKYILCGHSLGARVIYRTLDALSSKENQFVLNAHLLGGAVGSDAESWYKVKKAVAGNIVNYRSNNDYVLFTMYKLGTFFLSNPIGRHRINVNGIIDVDVSSTVNGHTEYKKNFSKIFYKANVGTTRNGNKYQDASFTSYDIFMMFSNYANKDLISNHLRFIKFRDIIEDILFKYDSEDITLFENSYIMPIFYVNKENPTPYDMSEKISFIPITSFKDILNNQVVSELHLLKGLNFDLGTTPDEGILYFFSTNSSDGNKSAIKGDKIIVNLSKQIKKVLDN